MRERAISAVVIAAVVIVFFLLGQPWLTFGIAALSLLAAIEVFRLMPPAGFPVQLLPGVVLPPILVLAMGLEVVDAGWVALYAAAVLVVLAIDAFRRPEVRDGFLAWVGRPAGSGPPWLTRYLEAIWRHRWDLQEAFPDLEGDDGDRYRSWLEERGRMEASIPESLMPRAAQPTAGGRAMGASPVGPGINVAGYLKAELGVGEAARQVIAAAAAAGEPVATFTFGQTRSRQDHPFEDLEPVSYTHLTLPTS